MAIKTMGTQLFVIDPVGGARIEVGCVTTIDGIDTTLDQIDITCLSALTRSFMAGLANPGTATFGINFDPADDSHVRLHALKVAGTTLQWAIGFSDGTSLPISQADTSGDFIFHFPGTRSWIAFEGYMNSYPFSFQQNAAVTSTVGIQVSGEPAVIPK